MHLFKPTVTSKGKQRRSQVWWVEFTVAGKRHRTSLKTRDRRTAERDAVKLIEQHERRAAGRVDPLEEHARRPLEEHLTKFEAELRARRCTDGHVADRMKALREFMGAAKATTIADLDHGAAVDWLASLQQQTDPRTGVAIGARTINKRRAALKQFGRWLITSRRASYDPFAGLPVLNEAEDPRHVRRAFTEAEFEALLAAARRRPLERARAERTSAGVSEAEERRLGALGETRALVYDVAAGTGLRHQELGKLEWRHVDLERAVITVTAKTAKSRVEQVVPLRSDLVRALEARKGTSAPTDRVFAPTDYPTLRTFKLDLVEAGLARRLTKTKFDTRDASGRELDFHSLRVTFGTRLAQAGVPPAIARVLMRHSTIDLTLRHYTDQSLLDLRGALERTIGGGRVNGGMPPVRTIGGPTIGAAPPTSVALPTPEAEPRITVTTEPAPVTVRVGDEPEAGDAPRLVLVPAAPAPAPEVSVAIAPREERAEAAPQGRLRVVVPAERACRAGEDPSKVGRGVGVDVGVAARAWTDEAGLTEGPEVVGQWVWVGAPGGPNGVLVGASIGMETKGIEPSTSGLQSQRSPN